MKIMRTEQNRTSLTAIKWNPAQAQDTQKIAFGKSSKLYGRILRVTNDIEKTAEVKAKVLINKYDNMDNPTDGLRQTMDNAILESAAAIRENNNIFLRIARGLKRKQNKGTKV